MSITGWDLHDGAGAFGVQVNPHTQRLHDAAKALAEANIAIDSTSIGGRIRIRQANDRHESVKAAHKKWEETNAANQN